MEYLILCIGNREGGDDAIGPYIADRLKTQELDNLLVVDCGIAPENYTSVVKQYDPKYLVLIDAVDIGLDTGEIRIIPREKIGTMHISTHGIPLSIFMNYLSQYVDDIILIGIQPLTMSGEMSATVKQSGDEIIQLIKTRRFDQIKRFE